MDNESYTAYLKRIVGMVTDGLIGYTEMGDALLGSQNVYSSENLRKAYYVLAKIVDNLEGDLQITDNDIIREIELQKDELYKERVRYRDKVREFNKKLTEEARYENLTSVLQEEVAKLAPIELNPYKPATNRKRITAVCQLSDWHIGKYIDNQWNFYNNDIAVERANSIVDKVISKSKIHNITDLVLEINGDMIEGLIQVSAKNEEDVISQITFVSELLAQVVNKLKPYFESMKIVTTLGNHGRLFADKKMGSTKENFEMLIPEFLKLRIGDVQIVKSYGLDFTAYEIDGKFICLTHGQNDKLSDVIADFTKMYKRVPNEIHLGHTHAYKDINDCDIYVTVNGCLSGADDYALTCRKVTKAAQNLIIYDDDRCIYSLVVD